ncbi:MAG: glutathione S-transferase family protein [Pseudomonadota bacterium]|nr:glutathione S-transferase family protein [Pseudomonadota bacterium]
MADLHFITAEVCPYAQRTHMALREKGLDYEHTEVDLKNKPVWFEEVSPYSKVPVLKCGDQVLYESVIINEFLDETFPEPALMPSDPFLRAQARVWIDYSNTRFIEAIYDLLGAKDAEVQTEQAAKLTACMEYMEDRGLKALGSDPFWLGSEVSLVDIAYWPFFERLPAVTHYRGVGIPERCTRLKAWAEAMEARDSVQSTMHQPDYYIQSYSRHAQAAAE